MVVDGPISSQFTVPLCDTITSFPNAVLDTDNGNLVVPYYTNAEVPSTSYRIDTPASIDACDDVFVLPHADPTWETHNNLIPFNRSKGFIWSACHAVSVLENIDNPNDPDINPDMNFLSENGLVDYGAHGDGTLPYSYSDPSHPIMQFLGILDGATTNGSEQIYLPNSFGWRSSTTISVWDPDHPDIPAISPGEAAVIAYGRGFGNPGNGMVMYEGGHSHNNGTEAEKVAAQRAFFNFILLAGIERRPEITVSIPDSVGSGETADVSVTVSGGSPPYTYQWSSNCGGTFADPTAASTIFTAPLVDVGTSCIIRLTVKDSCPRPRQNFSAKQTIITIPDLEVTKIVDIARPNEGDTVTYTVTVNNNGPSSATNIEITDLLPAGVSYASDTLSQGSYDSGTGVWMVGDLADGASATLTITATVDTDTGGNVITNTASVTAVDQADPDPSNNTDSADITVQVAPLITVTKTVDKTSAKPGETLTYTITYENIGDGNARDVYFVDLIPENTTYVIGSAAGAGTTIKFQHVDGGPFDSSETAPVTAIMWQLTEPLPPEGSGTLTLQVKIN